MQSPPLIKRPPHRTNKRACQFCKVRHLRCDGLEPCVNCEHRGSECIYPPDPLYDNIIAMRPKTTAATQNPNQMAPPAKRTKLAASGDDIESSKSSEVHAISSTHYQPIFDSNSLSLTAGAPPHPPTQMTAATSAAAHQSALPPIAATPASIYSNQPQVPLPQMNFNPSPFIPSNTAVPTPPVGAPLRPGSSLVLSYARTVQPVASAQFTTKDAAYLQRILQTEKARLAYVETSALVKAFVECVMVAHGSRYSGNPTLAQRYADKAYQIFLLLISSREYAPDSPHAADFAPQIQALVSGIELLTYFLIGSDELIRARQMSCEAYRLLSLYPDQVTHATMHRIYTLMVGQANDSEDALYFWDKAQRVIDTTPNFELEMSAYVIFSLAVTGRHPARCEMDRTISTARNSGSSASDIALVERILNFLNKFEEEVAKFQASGSSSAAAASADAATLVRVYTAIITGSRAICLWQLGKREQSIEFATQLIHMGRASSVIPLTYIQCYAYACKIAQVAGLTDLLKLGLATLEQDCELYPLTKRMYLDIRRAAKLDPPPASAPFAPMQNSSTATMDTATITTTTPTFFNGDRHEHLPPAAPSQPYVSPSLPHPRFQSIIQQQQQRPIPTGPAPVRPPHHQQSHNNPPYPHTNNVLIDNNNNNNTIDHFGVRPFEHQYAPGMIRESVSLVDPCSGAPTPPTTVGTPWTGYLENNNNGSGALNLVSFPFGPGSPGMTISELEAGQLFDPAPFWPGSYI